MADQTDGGSDLTPVVVLGCPRSGTTLLASLLGRTPGSLVLPESGLLRSLAPHFEDTDATLSPQAVRSIVGREWRMRMWPGGAPAPDLGPEPLSFAEAVDLHVREVARRAGRQVSTIWVDHAPANARVVHRLSLVLPAAHFVHIVRDPRGVAASVLPLDWGPNTAMHAGRWWMARIAPALAAELVMPERVTRVRYEDLVADPGSIAALLRQQTGLPLELGPVGDASWLPAYTAGQHRLVGGPLVEERAHRWRTELSAPQVMAVENEVRDLIPLLGYELVYGLRAKGPGPWTRVREDLREVAVRELVVRRRRRNRRRVHAPPTDT